MKCVKWMRFKASVKKNVCYLNLTKLICHTFISILIKHTIDVNVM